MEKLNLYSEGICDLFYIRQKLPHEIWDATTADGGTNLLTTRILHNKPTFIASGLARCYILPLDPYFIGALTLPIVPFILIAGFFAIKNKLKILYVPFLLVPILIFFGIPFPGYRVIFFYRWYLWFLTALISIILSFRVFIKIFSSRSR